MDLTQFAGAAAMVSWTVWYRMSALQRLLLPMVLLYGSSLGYALQALSGVFSILAGAMRGAGFAFLALELVKRIANRGRAPSIVAGARSSALCATLLGVIVASHAVVGGTGGLPLSAWGQVFSLLAFAYWVVFASDVREIIEQNPWVVASVASLSVLVCSLLLGVRFGILAGNTAKAAMGGGGVGLLNLSTNETAALAVAPLLWSLRLLSNGRTSLERLGFFSALCSVIAVLLTGSRLGVLAVTVLIGSVALRRPSVRLSIRRVTAWVSLLAVFAAAAFVVRARTQHEVESFSAGSIESAQFAVPGGERAILWVSYLSSFAEIAELKPWYWVVGGGPAGLYSTYVQSPLPLIGITIDSALYYPVHSDFLELLMMTGLIGFSGIAGIMVGVRSIPVPIESRGHAARALFVVAAFLAVDMLQFDPGVLAVALAAFAVSVGEPHRLESRL